MTRERDPDRLRLDRDDLRRGLGLDRRDRSAHRSSEKDGGAPRSSVASTTGDATPQAAEGVEAPDPIEEPVSDAPERKERVLHTRIPAVLEQELKKLAENLRVPVSNLVRTILEDALSLADRAGGEVERQLRDAARRVSDEREHLRERRRRLEPLDDVLGFQSIVLAQATSCAKCKTSLPAASHAWLGITSEPGPRIIVCQRCSPPGTNP